VRAERDFAFRELGHAIRTSFLLEYLSDVELRRLIHSAQRLQKLAEIVNQAAETRRVW